MTQMIEMSVTGLTVDPFTNMPIVILKNETQTIALPIWIGLIEASSIATEFENIELSRPMTHDVFKDVLTKLNAYVTQVEINDLVDNTFFATIRIRSAVEDIDFAVDCRPSDAIAMSLRTKAPILVDQKVIEKSREIENSGSAPEKLEEQKWAEILENLEPEDFGKYKM